MASGCSAICLKLRNLIAWSIAIAIGKELNMFNEMPKDIYGFSTASFLVRFVRGVEFSIENIFQIGALKYSFYYPDLLSDSLESIYSQITKTYKYQVELQVHRKFFNDSSTNGK